MMLATDIPNPECVRLRRSSGLSAMFMVSSTTSNSDQIGNVLYDSMNLPSAFRRSAVRVEVQELAGGIEHNVTRGIIECIVNLFVVLMYF